jgi:hypothetical protein
VDICGNPHFAVLFHFFSAFSVAIRLSGINPVRIGEKCNDHFDELHHGNPSLSSKWMLRIAAFQPGARQFACGF